MSSLRTQAACLKSVGRDGVFADRLPAHTFAAFKLAETKEGSTFNGEAIPLAVVLGGTLKEALNEALGGPVIHKDTVLIHEVHTARRGGLLHAYRIRQGQRDYRRNPASGLSEPFAPLKPDYLFTLPVDRFEPKRPFDAFRDDPTGTDNTLVESRND